MPMIQRKIGDAVVSAIGFGAMGLSVGYGDAPSDEERLKILDLAYATGSTLWDTADVYGDNEDLLGKWFKLNPEKRKDIFLCTKFGYGFQTCHSEPEYIHQQVSASLKRLGVDYIDLLYQHRGDPNVPVETVVSTMAEYVKAGKVKYLGLSECSAVALRRAHAVHPISALQVEYSPFALEVEQDPINLVQTAKELGVTVVAYSPLGRGILTGALKTRQDLPEGDFRLGLPKFSEENFPKVVALVEKIKAVAAKHGASAGQAVLAWILEQGDHFVVIPGTKKAKYLLDNVEAANVKLSVEDIAEIRRLSEVADRDLPRERYSAGQMHQLYVDSPPLV
ncbi:Aldo/keto reductase [Cylindrobasidium torrendii FP15055 ss-10]|uniref:Aldo/keto reductase n=1 Tax=Cylindrobasidium torrendii FP15055 ss-10 TaxID=1314674 RepID=A0A0D7BCX0_9AGAR|nr:Aldo/keto reductase [Cylindrobasidium torrendii FP15055 ss-10]